MQHRDFDQLKGHLHLIVQAFEGGFLVNECTVLVVRHTHYQMEETLNTIMIRSGII